MFNILTKTRNRFGLFFNLIVIVSLGVLIISILPKQVNANELKIASFNIQVLGKKKVSNVEVRKVLISIISRYDIIFIQELRDKSGLAIKKLLTEVNKVNKDKYSMVLSNRLGSSSSKEQYVYFYKKNKVKLLKTFQYRGSNYDFERDPFTVKFKKGNNVFTITGVHIDPDLVKKELNYLDEVLHKVQRKLSTKNNILLGDLNADCKYLSKYRLSNLDLKKDRDLVWFIDSKQDTTVNTKTDCAYDRIISTSNISKNIYNSKVYEFEKDFNLDYKQALKISDHYPVEFILKFKNWLKISSFLLLYLKKELYFYSSFNFHMRKII